MNDDDSFSAPIAALGAQQLSLVSRLARELNAKALEVLNAEQRLKALQGELQEIERQRLPDAMGELGMKKVTLTGGATIEVKPVYTASIPKERLQEALSWLRKHDFGDLIKNFVTVTFGKGEDKLAVKLYKQLLKANKKTDRPVEMETGIHPQTLKALVKSEYESGEDPLPEDLFGIFIFNRAEIKQPKSST